MEGEKDDEISIDLEKITGFFKKKKNEGKKPEVVAEAKQEEQHAAKTKAAVSEGKLSQEKEDEEIALDLSWVKNIFKGKEPSSAEVETKADKEEDEISIDLSKLKNIKNVFKKPEHASSDEEFSVDLKKISDFFVRYKVVLLLLIPIFLSIYLRVQPAYLPATDDWATSYVTNSIKSQISNQIDQQYPNLPAQNKDTLVENELQKILKQQKSQVEQQIKATSNFFKSELQDDKGLTYLVALDPYFWMRHAENILKNGHPGDEIRNGQQWDTHMLAPEGRPVPYDMFHAYFSAYLFKFLSFFNRNLSLAQVMFYIPVLLSTLAIIPAFFITRKIAGNFGGFIAAMIITIHPSFLQRTLGGFADTDAYNVMFPLFIAWIFLEALDAKSIKNSIILSALSGILIGLFSFAWSGWWYVFDFILASTVFYIAYYAFAHKKELKINFFGFIKQKPIKNSMTFILIFFLVSAFSVTLFANFTQFTGFFKGPLRFTQLKEVGINTIWPNVFTTVAEQNPASLDNVINDVGLGRAFFFLIALMGIVLTTIKREHKKGWFVVGTLVWYLILTLFHDAAPLQDLHTFLILVSIPIISRIGIALWESDTVIDIKYAILLILWFIGTTFASTKGIRFTLLLVPAFAIGFGIALGELYRYASVWITKGLQVNKYISKTTVIIMLLSLLILPYKSALGIANSHVTDFSDAWKESLEKIKEDSKPDAIINSWWDFGHWFKFWADRAVTFDGTSQNTPQAHWIGKVLLTDDEELAIGILRMLDCSGYFRGSHSFDKLFELTKDQVESINIMYEIMPLSREEAKKILIKKFAEKDVEDVLELTHCQPPEDYFITSEDMVGKSSVWSHFGSWDYDRALIFNTLKKKNYSDSLDKSVAFLKERFNYSGSEAEDLFYEVKNIANNDEANSWIAPWPGYAGEVDCSKDENILTCDNGFTINLTSKEAFAQSKEGMVHPKRISFPTNEGVVVKEYNESLIALQNGRDIGFALIGGNNSYRLVQMDADLTASMFTRLFYQEGIGLRYFKKFSDETSILGERIIVWKVDWEGKEKNIVEAPKPETGEAAKTPEIKKENITFNSSQNMS